MATQYRRFAVTIPAGTPQNNPIIVNTRFETFAVSQIDILIPPGPLGQMGFQIASSRVQVIPWNAGAFIVSNGEHLVYPLTDAPDSGDWQVIGYNTGVFPHTIQVQFALDPVKAAAAPTVTVTTADLSTVDTSPVQTAANGTVVLVDTSVDTFAADLAVP